MSRYIDADATLNIIKKYLYETALNNFTTDRKVSDICENIAIHRIATWIDKVPTADVVPMAFHNKVLEVEIKKQENLVEVVRCKDCKHQRKLYHADARRKDGGYFIYWCDLVDGYSPVCLDDDYCSKGERIYE